MLDLIDVVGTADALISDKQIRRIHHVPGLPCNFPDRVHNIRRRVKQLCIIFQTAGKILPADKPDSLSRCDTGLLQQFCQAFAVSHRLIRQGEIRRMNGLRLNSGRRNLIQILISHHHVMGSALIEHQKCLLKTRQETGQVLKVVAVFQICIHHQGVKVIFFHTTQHAVVPFLHGFVCQHHWYTGTVRYRFPDFFVDNVCIFFHEIPSYCCLTVTVQSHLFLLRSITR